MSEYTIKTVSGNIVTFNDSGDNLPLSSCVVTIPPNLNGVSSVKIEHTGKNLVNFSDAVLSTSGGLNYIANSDGSISYSGTTTTTWTYITDNIPVSFEKGTTLVFSRNAAFEYRHNVRLTLIDDTVVNVIINAGDTYKTHTTTDKVKGVRLYMSQLASETAYSGTVYAMLQAGDTASEFEKYNGEEKTAQLGKIIYGGPVDVVNGTGTETNELVPFSDCTWAVVTSYQSNFNADNGIISLRFGKTAMETAGYAQTIDGVACNVFVNNNRTVWNSTSRLNEIGYSDGISVNLHYSDIGLSEWTSNASDTLTAWRSSQLYQTGAFSLVKATPEDFTFTPVLINSWAGDNTMWSDSGDIEVSYYSFIESVGRYIISDTTLTDIANAIREKKETTAPINVNNFASEILTISGGGGQPTLISKSITENGTYLASDDEADGYSDVTVNVPTGPSYPITIPKLIGYNYDATNVIFTESYTTYPLLKITLASFNFTGPYYKEYSFYMTPTMIDTIFTDHTYLNFGTPYRSERVSYTKGSDTEWVRYNNVTNIYVKNVYGLTFINYDVTETLLYNRNGYGSANVTFDPPAGHTFDEYDYILFSTCTSDPYYQTPSYNFYCKNLAPDTEIGSGFGDINRENFSEKCIRLASQNTNYYCYFNKTTISSLPYSVVVALTLTPKSEAVNVPEVYEKIIADPFRAKYSTYWTDWYYCNPNSHAYVSNDTLMYDLDFRMVTRSGHEGYCFDLADLNLESGKTYKISFDFFVSDGSWSNQYRWGLKYSSTQIESTNSAFNIDTDITFARQTGWQTVELTFTANSNNYLAFCLSDSSSSALYACKNIIFEEVT